MTGSCHHQSTIPFRRKRSQPYRSFSVSQPREFDPSIYVSVRRISSQVSCFAMNMTGGWTRIAPVGAFVTAIVVFAFVNSPYFSRDGIGASRS
jgi:hypothetical protein